MRRVGIAMACLALLGGMSYGETTFDVTGTAVPPDLLRQNYGPLPKGITAYDLSICNSTANKQSILSSQIYQALIQTNPDLQPIGRQIMLAAILRNQGRNPLNIAGIALTSVTAVLTVVGASRYRLPTQWATGLAIVSLSTQPILAALKPVMTVDQLQKFESQVLETSLVLDPASCVERTVFSVAPSIKKERAATLSFHVH